MHPRLCFLLLLVCFTCHSRLAAQLNECLGIYRQEGDSSLSLKIKLYNSRLQLVVPGQKPQWLLPVSRYSFRVQDSLPLTMLRFIPGESGQVRRLNLEQNEKASSWLKKTGLYDDASLITRYGNRINGFSRSDTLRGMLSPLRSCYDVVFYHLDVNIDTLQHSVSGSNLIRFKATRAFNRLQFDLFANMVVEKVLYHNRPLPFTRELDAVYVQFPMYIRPGTMDAITVYYHGKPQVPDFDIPMTGGIFWSRDDNNHFWMETVCQGSGASLWWPNKDHLSDEPDSMHISVTVPSGLEEISNGQLVSKEALPGSRTRYNWVVHYPINNYNVAVNIGDYVHFNDTLQRPSGVLDIRYHCLRQHLERARQLFSEVKPMLRLYEQAFGTYPFARDGFTLMESVYPMEHQGAVSVGKLEGKTYNPMETLGTMWHEAAHEWWGNNVSVKDFADLWIHEGFADFATALNIPNKFSRVVLANYYKQQNPANKEPVTGVYNVNHFFYSLDDAYTKGNLMLNTLRHVIHNDSAWFALLRGIQSHFQYQTITADTLIQYINRQTKTDYTYFFTQYLQQLDIPELQVQLKQLGDNLQLRYRWVASVPGFRLPIQVTKASHRYDFIYPTTNWQMLVLPGMDAADFAVAGKDKFYVQVRISGKPPVVQPGKDLLRQYQGKYELKNTVYRITEKEGELYIESEAAQVPLMRLAARKPGVFCWEYAGIDLEFVRDAGGAVKEILAYDNEEILHLKKVE